MLTFPVLESYILVYTKGCLPFLFFCLQTAESAVKKLVTYPLHYVAPNPNFC